VSTRAKKVRELKPIECVVKVDASKQRVWDALVAWETQDEWMMATKVIVPDGAPREGVGAKIEAFTGMVPGRRWVGFLDTMTVTLWEPPHRCDVIHTGRVVRGTGTFEVVADSPEQSTFIWREELDLPFGFLGRAAWPIVKPLMRQGVLVSLRRFARYAESLNSK
jgi:hypothetical protein